MAMDNFTRFLVRTDSSSKLVDAATADLALAAKGRGSGTTGKADSSSKEVAQTGAAQNPKKPSRTSSMAKLFGGIGGVFGKKKNSKAMAARMGSTMGAMSSDRSMILEEISSALIISGPSGTKQPSSSL